MKTVKKNRLLVLAAVAALACILQVVGLVLYLNRLPDDWVGIGLYITTIVAFALVAAGFYTQWRRQKAGDDP